MSIESECLPESSQKIAAYTTDRLDIFELVPHESLSILDVGCSNGSLGWSLKVAQPNRVISCHA